MTFETYLTEKKIDSQSFRAEDPEQWNALEHIFMQVHPKSFTAQKLYLINPLRRRFPLVETPTVEKAAKAKPGRPVMKPRPKDWWLKIWDVRFRIEDVRFWIEDFWIWDWWIWDLGFEIEDVGLKILDWRCEILDWRF